MKPVFDINRDVDYRRSVFRGLRAAYGNIHSALPSRFLQTANKFTDLKLGFVDEVMQDRYSKYGPAPRRPSDMLRSVLLAIVWRVPSWTKWVDLLRTVPFLAIVSGFDPTDVPGVGTFYDFSKRLWLSDEDNFSPSVRPKRERPRKPRRKGEKAPPVEKKPVEDLIAAFANEPSSELDPASLLWRILDIGFLQRSESEGLINMHSLTIAGDGTPVRTAARERMKRTCNCLEIGISDCTCDRFHSQPDCDWGYDSHRNCYFFGYDLYLMSDPTSKHDLPIFPFLGPASRHDSHGLVHTWFAAKSFRPDFHASTVLLDSAHDALAIYRLFDDEGVQAVIDLNKGHFTPIEQKDYTIGPDGIPVCSAGHPMKNAGFDKAQHRIKFRCPKIHMRQGNIVCECDNPCSQAKYGRQVHVYPSSNPRLFCTPARGSAEWKEVYKARTGSERVNKRIKCDYLFEQGNHRSTRLWYCRLFAIMMCIHLDAWSLSNSMDQLADAA